MTKYQQQVNFCKKNNYPVFAPEKYCNYCGGDIYKGDTVDVNKLITRCPICGRSFV